MYLEFLLLSNTGQRTENRVYVPISYMWQEGPLDTNIQFTQDEDHNFCPKLDQDERYVIPDPENPTKPARAYHLGIVPGPFAQSQSKLSKSWVFTPTNPYLTALKNLWDSPNS